MNKYQKAFKSLKEKYERTLPYDDDEDLIEELVDRATPKKPNPPKPFGFLGYDKCPVCNTIVIKNYCSHCGQAIDWSENE